MAKNNKTTELPKLPYGMGSYSWRDKDQTVIQFRKTLVCGENKLRRTVYGQTVSECNNKMANEEKRFMEQCAKGQNLSPRNPSMPIKTAIFQWMEKYKLPVMKSKSYDTLEDTYKNHILTADFADKQVEQVTDDDIQCWLNNISAERSNSTTKKCYSLIKMYMDFYYQKRPYDNPVVTVAIPKKETKIQFTEEGLPVNPNKAYEVLNDEEAKLFEEEAEKPLEAGIGGYKHGLFLIFVMWSFMRYGEALALQWKDIDFDNNIAYVYKTYSYVVDRKDENRRRKWELTVAKTQDGIRFVYLCDNAMKALREHRARKESFTGDNDFIFTTESGKPIPNDHLNRLMRTVLRRAGITKKVTLHGLRHTGISFFMRHGVDVNVVSKSAGHRSTDITQKIYYSIIQEQYKQEIDRINSLS